MGGYQMNSSLQHPTNLYGAICGEFRLPFFDNINYETTYFEESKWVSSP